MIDPAAHFRWDSAATHETQGIFGWRVPTDLPYLDGHFPGNPVLPAVAIIDGSWQAIGAIRRADAGADEMRELASAKFLRPIQPGNCLSLTVERMPPGASAEEVPGSVAAARADWRVRWRLAGVSSWIESGESPRGEPSAPGDLVAELVFRNL